MQRNIEITIYPRTHRFDFYKRKFVNNEAFKVHGKEGQWKVYLIEAPKAKRFRCELWKVE